MGIAIDLFKSSSAIRLFSFTAILAALLLTVGCGGGRSGTNTGNNFKFATVMRFVDESEMPRSGIEVISQNATQYSDEDGVVVFESKDATTPLTFEFKDLNTQNTGNVDFGTPFDYLDKIGLHIVVQVDEAGFTVSDVDEIDADDSQVSSNNGDEELINRDPVAEDDSEDSTPKPPTNGTPVPTITPAPTATPSEPQPYGIIGGAYTSSGEALEGEVEEMQGGEKVTINGGVFNLPHAVPNARGIILLQFTSATGQTIQIRVDANGVDNTREAFYVNIIRTVVGGPNSTSRYRTVVRVKNRDPEKPSAPSHSPNAPPQSDSAADVPEVSEIPQDTTDADQIEHSNDNDAPSVLSEISRAQL